jgi:tyrosyl-tRNA synthetase
MSIADELMPVFFELCTDVPLTDIAEIKRELQCGAIHPMDVKKRLAREIVTIYHSEAAANEAQSEFERVFSQREIPEDMPTCEINDDDLEDGAIRLVKLLITAGMATSNSEARRLIQQGAVTIDGEKLTDPLAAIQPCDGQVLRAGKLKFARINRV